MSNGKGRPKDNERVINERFQLNIKKDTREELEKLSEKLGISTSEIVRTTIVKYLIEDTAIPELPEMTTVGIRLSKEVKSKLYEKAGDNSTYVIRYLLEQLTNTSN